MSNPAPEPVPLLETEPGIYPAQEALPVVPLDLETGPPNEPRQERMVRLAARLMQVGVSQPQIVRLLMFDLDKVERQLNWLPFRSARKKASLIVSAIEHDYERPANLEGYAE